MREPTPRRLLALAGAALAAASSAAHAEEFDTVAWRVAGRPIEVHVVEVDGAPWLAAIHVEGTAPGEKRHVTLRAPDASERSLAPPAGAVAVDFAELDAAPGPEVVWLASERLTLVRADGTPLREIALAPPLPLPPRTRELSRLRMVDDWDSRGAPEALVPSLLGLRVVPLAGDGAPRELRLPITSTYRTLPGEHPLGSGFATAYLVWPQLARVDDDGDGRLDLFAATRFAVGVYRAGADGLAATPRVRRIPPFSAEEEVNWETTVLRALPADLDGDHRADLIVHRTVGKLMGSRAHTAIHANRAGEGADPSGPPVATLAREGGFSTVTPIDLDGDGRDELFESSLSFGVAQLVRILTIRRAEVELRVLRFADGLAQPQTTWSGSTSLPWDLGASRLKAMLPVVDCDWNGDGLRDLAYGDGEGSARIRLGTKGALGPAFGEEAGRAPSANASTAIVADVDGDGLDDLVSWDELDTGGLVTIARNRGTLPGTRPTLRPAE